MVTKDNKAANQAAAQAKAEEAIATVHAEAKKEMADYPKSVSIAIEGETKDKRGEATKVLVMDRDLPGWRRIHVRRGLPISFDPATKAMKTDEDLLYDYMNHMANIDLDDDANLEAIGEVAIEEARSFVLGFFLLLWGSALKGGKGTAS